MSSAVRTWYLPAPCTALAWLARSQLLFAASLAAPLPSIRLYSLAPRPALLSSQPATTPEPHLVSSFSTASPLLLRSLLLDNASLIVSASSSGIVSIHSGTDLQVHTSAKLYRSAVAALAAAPSGIASAGTDGSLHLHSVSALNSAPLATYTDAAGSIISLAWISPHLIAACGAGANVSLLDVRAKLTAQRLVEYA